MPPSCPPTAPTPVGPTVPLMPPSHPPAAPTPVGPTVPPMPAHWKIGKSDRFPRLKAGLLYIGVGETSMEAFWVSSYPGSPRYQKRRDARRERIAHINVVVSTKLYRRVYERLIHVCPFPASLKPSPFENSTGGVAPRDDRCVLHDGTSLIFETGPIYAPGFVHAVLFFPRTVVRRSHSWLCCGICGRGG